MRWLVNLRPLVSSLDHGRRRGGRGSRQERSSVVTGGTSGPKAFTFLLRLLVTHFDRVHRGKGYTKLHTFGTYNGTLFYCFFFVRDVRVLMSTATGSGRVLSPGDNVVLELVRMAVNEHFSTRMPTLYLGSEETDSRPYASLDARWPAFNDLALI